MSDKLTAQGPVTVERVEGLAVITLDRPEAMNAMSPALAEGLLDALVACDDDAAVRAVMITGAGAAFCAGGDVRAMVENMEPLGGATRFLKQLTIPVHGAIATMGRMPKPVIGAVNGVAAGAGFSLALACDLVVAARSASFTMAYTRIGAAPDGGSTHFLTRLVGAKRAYAMIASNPVLSAEEARALGIVNEVFPDEGFADAARAWAGRLAAGPTRALGLAKQLVAGAAGSSLETQLERERRAIAESGGTEDFREGTRAFVEKRQPRFTGR